MEKIVANGMVLAAATTLAMLSSLTSETRFKLVLTMLQAAHPDEFKTADEFQADDPYNYLAEPYYQRSCLGGKVHQSLLKLNHLSYLDLSKNNFDHQIPKFIGSLRELKYLNLSEASFSGTIPPHLGNLSSLQSLDLSSNFLEVDNLHWLVGLASLKHLSMDGVDLSQEGGDWLEHVNMLPSLVELSLSWCQLQGLPLSISVLNLTSLQVLDLSGNGFNSPMPRWFLNCTCLTTLNLGSNNLNGSIPESIGNLKSLQILDLRGNQFEGRIPKSLGNLYNLRSLDLSGNSIEGRIPRSLGTLCNLHTLHLSYNNISGQINEFVETLSKCSKNNLKSFDLSINNLTGYLPLSLGNLKSLSMFSIHDNKINGTIPESLGQLSELVELNLGYNFWEGVVSETHFSNLTKLKILRLLMPSSSKSLILNINTSWVCPFQLTFIELGNCQLGPRFPSWIQNQKNIFYLALVNVNISDAMPDWFTYSYPSLQTLDLSNNQITGTIPLGAQIRFLDLSGNLFSGHIPSNICKLTSLGAIYLSNNRLSGELPQWCWKNLKWLIMVDLSNNHLSGNIPNFPLQLTCLKLNNNNLTGKFPSSLQNSKWRLLNLGENRLSGKIPTWMGTNHLDLKVLRLRSNLFIGDIPNQLCSLRSLHILDLALNKLQGSIPNCFQNLSSMTTTVAINDDPSIDYTDQTTATEELEDVNVKVDKGHELEYEKNLNLVRSMDLSSNDLSGDIPDELTKLLGLGILNLSMNHFTGMIPRNIGHLTQLELLDLSSNQLTGSIPESLSNLTSLSLLNLSWNDLSGIIPTGPQLQTFTSSIYDGNPKLCGSPLLNICSSNKTSPNPVSIMDGKEKEDISEMLGIYISITLGFVVGFWGFCGTLILKKSWRSAYSNFLEEKIDNIYVFVVVRIARWQRRGMESM